MSSMKVGNSGTFSCLDQAFISSWVSFSSETEHSFMWGLSLVEPVRAFVLCTVSTSSSKFGYRGIISLAVGNTGILYTGISIGTYCTFVSNLGSSVFFILFPASSVSYTEYIYIYIYILVVYPSEEQSTILTVAPNLRSLPSFQCKLHWIYITIKREIDASS